jgi:hypothetical protein
MGESGSEKGTYEGNVSKHPPTAFAIELTINALESAAWRDINVVAIGTKELYGICPWDV